MPKRQPLSRNFSAKSLNFALNNHAVAAKAEFCQPYWGQQVQKLMAKRRLFVSVFSLLTS